MEKTEFLILNLLSKSETKEKGFRLIMDTFQKSLYHQIFSLLKNHEDTKDVLQNTFIKIWKHIDSFQEKSKLSTWLYSIARNESLSFLNHRHQKTKSAMNEEGKTFVFGQLKAENYLKEEDILVKLQEAIDVLPPLQKEVFMLRYYNELKYSEMAKILNSSESTLKSSYHFAVKKIEAFLKED